MGGLEDGRHGPDDHNGHGQAQNKWYKKQHLAPPEGAQQRHGVET
jgi:hypothetical protein